MTWVTPRAALQMIGKKKLAQLTTEPGQQEPIGVGDATTKIFPTPFYFVADLKVYADAVLVESGCALSIARDGQVFATFGTAPADKAILTASSTDAVNGENLNKAFVEAQGKVRGMVDAALYETPADDAPVVPPLILGWAADIAWYLVMRGPRRPRLLEAYPEFEKAYLDTFGGIDAAGGAALSCRWTVRTDIVGSGVLPYRGSQPPFEQPTPDTSTQPVEFSSVPRVYGGGRGVF